MDWTKIGRFKRDQSLMKVILDCSSTKQRKFWIGRLLSCTLFTFLLIDRPTLCLPSFNSFIQPVRFCWSWFSAFSCVCVAYHFPFNSSVFLGCSFLNFFLVLITFSHNPCTPLSLKSVAPKARSMRLMSDLQCSCRTLLDILVYGHYLVYGNTWVWPWFIGQNRVVVANLQ